MTKKIFSLLAIAALMTMLTFATFATTNSPPETVIQKVQVEKIHAENLYEETLIPVHTQKIQKSFSPPTLTVAPEKAPVQNTTRAANYLSGGVGILRFINTSRLTTTIGYGDPPEVLRE